MERWHFGTRRYVPHELYRAHARGVRRARALERPAARGRPVPRRRAAARPPDRRARGELGPHRRQGRHRAVLRRVRRPERGDARRPRPLPRRSAASASSSPAGRRPTSTRGSVRARSTRASSRSFGLDPTRPLVVVMGNTPTNTPYEDRFVERMVEWWKGVGRRPSVAPLPAASARPGVARAISRRARDGGRRRAGGELHRLRGARDAAPALRLRRRERGDDPARRARQRPALRLRPLRRGRSAGRELRDQERHRRALPRARGVERLLPRRRRSRRSSTGIERALAHPTSSPTSAGRVALRVVGEVDGRAGERVVDAIVTTVERA